MKGKESMENDEILSLIEQLKGQGMSDEEIMDVYYETFKKGEMDRKDLEVLAEALGYELTDDFKEDEHADPMAAPESGEISKEDAEDLKEIKPGESEEEFKEKVEEAKEGAPEAEDKAEDTAPQAEEEKEDDEESERKEAMKLFDLD